MSARVGAVVVAVAVVGLAIAGLAIADPSALTWAKLRQCESSDNYQAVSPDGTYRGAYQFDQSTWNSVGGSGSPDDASPAEQDYRALYLYRMRGWQPWECADSAHLDLHEDSEGGSGVAPSRQEASYISNPSDSDSGSGDSSGGSSDGSSSGSGNAGSGDQGSGDQQGSGGQGSTGSGGGASSGGAGSGSPNLPTPPPNTVPRWDGHVYVQGNCSSSIRTFQLRLNQIGATYHFQATGCYQQHTHTAVIKLQKANGINPSGRLGPKTWYAAWNGTGIDDKPSYTAPSSAPKWDGLVYSRGDCSASLRTFQLRLNQIGANPKFTGTGCYDGRTYRAVVALQKANGINPSGRLGPKTWQAAWDGKPLS